VLRANPLTAGEHYVGVVVDGHVAKRTTLNSGGVVPLALGIPALLGALTFTIRTRRRVA
jgi:hypothetical protein